VIRDLQPHNAKGNELKHEQESECKHERPNVRSLTAKLSWWKDRLMTDD